MGFTQIHKVDHVNGIHLHPPQNCSEKQEKKLLLNKRISHNCRVMITDLSLRHLIYWPVALY